MQHIQLRTYSAIVLAITILSASCAKEETEGFNLAAGNFMTASVDSNYWNATQITYTHAGTGILFTGSRDTAMTEQVQLLIPAYHGTGTYEMNNASAVGIYRRNGSAYISVEGSLTVLEDDAAHIAAGFDFTGQDSSTGSLQYIRNGQLNINK